MTEKNTKKAAKKPVAKKATASKVKLSSKEKAMTKTIAKLEEKVAELESQIDDQQARVEAAEEKMLRVVAEYENGKRRLEREKERSLSFAKDRVLMGLFPIIDNLERSAKWEKEHESEDTKQHGVKLVLEQIGKFLKDTSNIESFDPMGEAFDPEFHEAMAMRPVEGEESGKVIEVFEKGYRDGDRVLRAAKVVVSE